jgi:DNA-binding PucR family transcriptional regulator
MVAWLDEPPEDRDPLSLLEGAITRVAQTLTPGRPLLQARGTQLMAAWLGSVGPFARSVTAVELSPELDAGVRLAVGNPGDGPRGFRDSFHQATLALRVARLTVRGPETVTEFCRVALESLATADVDQARAFVADTLGPLTPADELTRRLAATLQVFLEEDSSHSRAAKRLGIHENTVRYRVRQAEELLGRPLTMRSVELQVALRLAQTVPAGDPPPLRPGR